MIAPKVFIAHSEKDAQLGTALKECLVFHTFGSPTDVYLSSDGSIPPDQQFPLAIRAAVQGSRVVIVLLTPNSMWRPWVHFEAGGAHFFPDAGGGVSLPPKSLYVACANGVGPGSLPDNLTFYSVTDLAQKALVERMLRGICTQLGVPLANAFDPSRVERLCGLAAKGSRGWNLVSAGMIARTQGGSPFQLLEALAEATKLVFVAGQNLHSVSVGSIHSDAKKLVFEFLGRGGEVQILIQDPDYPHGRACWESLMAGFDRDLTESISGFRQWLREATAQGINTPGERRLDIRGATLVPTTFTFSDPDEPHGKMFVTPVLFRASQTRLRPVWGESGGLTNEVIRTYWGIWQDAFREARPL